MSSIARNSSSFICIDEESRILLLKRSFDDDIEPNKWCFAGGAVDDGENFEEGLIREVREELGVEILEFNFLKSYYLKDKNNSIGIRAVYFYGKAKGEIILNEEHLEYYWFDIEKDSLNDFSFAFNQRDVIEYFIKEVLNN